MIDFTSATNEEKYIIRDILISNYTNLVNRYVKEADYCNAFGYWKGTKPHGSIMKAKTFIKKYSK